MSNHVGHADHERALRASQQQTGTSVPGQPQWTDDSCMAASPGWGHGATVAAAAETDTRPS